MTTKKLKKLKAELKETDEAIRLTDQVHEALFPCTVSAFTRFKQNMQRKKDQLLDDIKTAIHEKLTK